MTRGAPIWFTQACRGGYEMQRRVPGIYYRATEHRIRIAVRLKDGSMKLVSVHPKNVSRRDAGD